MVWWYRYRRSNPVFWFLAFQWLIGVGTIALVELDRASDVAYVLLLFAALLAFLLGAYLAYRKHGLASEYHKFWQLPVVVDSPNTRTVTAGLLALSVAVTVVYYRAVGYNLLTQIVQGLESVDFTSARLAAYGGDTYFAPGYANQFKNVLLPLTLSAMGTWAWYRGNRRAVFLLAVLGLPFALWGLLGTGQRGAVVYALGAFLFGLAAITRIRALYLLVPATLVALIFGMFSVGLGRIDQLTASTVVSEILHRSFVVQQLSGLAGLRHIYEMDAAWFSEWIQGFLGLLPGHSGSNLANQVHEVMYGSARGTAPMSTVGSAFHNGGVVGVLLMYLGMGWLYVRLYVHFLRGRRTVLRSYTYGAMFFYLAFFVTDAPVGLINKGFVTLAIVLVIRKWIEGSEPKEDGHGSLAPFGSNGFGMVGRDTTYLHE